MTEVRMNHKNETTTDINGGGIRRFLASFLASLARDAFQLIVAFAVGTGAGAIACWYYGVPLVFSLLGGILVLALALALTTHSWFS
jgi:hypothetical protein